ncbi:MAG: MFS transporter, partial [Acutalibacteraceae bacterium]
PCAYVFMALFADVLDHIEWKCGFRCDGVSMSVYNIIAVSSVGICTGIFNMMLAKTGYIAPELNAAGELIAVQPEPVKKAITFAFVGLETITGIVLAVLLIFLSVEKGLKKKQDEIRVRKGLETVEPTDTESESAQ